MLSLPFPALCISCNRFIHVSVELLKIVDNCRILPVVNECASVLRKNFHYSPIARNNIRESGYGYTLYFFKNLRVLNFLTSLGNK